MIIAGTFPKRPERARRPARPEPGSDDRPPEVPGPRSGEGEILSEAPDPAPGPVEDQDPDSP